MKKTNFDEVNAFLDERLFDLKDRAMRALKHARAAAAAPTQARKHRAFAAIMDMEAGQKILSLSIHEIFDRIMEEEGQADARAEGGRPCEKWEMLIEERKVQSDGIHVKDGLYTHPALAALIHTRVQIAYDSQNPDEIIVMQGRRAVCTAVRYAKNEIATGGTTPRRQPRNDKNSAIKDGDGCKYFHVHGPTLVAHGGNIQMAAIAYHIEQQKITLKALAERAKVPYSSMKKYAKGLRPIPDKVWERIQAAIKRGAK